MAERMAFFGGTFDPVHFGHLITARAVAEQGGFERITLVPTSTPPHKRGAQASPAHRLAMLELAVEGDPMFDICPLELTRSGPSYTIDTLKGLRKEYGPQVELYWIIGADMLNGLDKWRRVGDILERVQLLVATRPPWDQDVERMLGRLQGAFGVAQIERIRRNVLSTPRVDISSSDIRNRVASNRGVRYLVPLNIMGYIEKHDLYR